MAQTAIKFAIGIGGMILSAVLAPKPKDQYGPRLSDINIAQVSPGNPIIRHWGTMKLPAQIIWVSEIMETVHSEEIGGGKKGGGGKKSATAYTYTYSVDLAVGVCKGPVHRVRRVWANHKLLWVNPDIAAEQKQAFVDAYYAELDRLVNQAGLLYYDQAYVGAFFFAFNNYRPDEYTYGTEGEAINFIMSHPGVEPHVVPPIPAPNQAKVTQLVQMMLDPLGQDMEYASNKLRFDAMNIYLGSDEQLPNAIMEGYMGVGNVPGYRGLCYIVMQNLQLEDFGNSIPSINVEVEKSSGQVFLHEIVHDICKESGLEDDEFNALAYMPTLTEIEGFAMTQSTSGRGLLNQLQSVFPFEGAETDYRLFFSWVNARPKAIIRREDFGAWNQGEEVANSYESTRTHDFDLPKRINLAFQEPVRAYSPNTVFAQRTETDSNLVEDIDTTIALRRDTAKTQVEQMLALKYTARRMHKIFLPRKYVIIEPGDAVLVPDLLDDTGHLHTAWRCVEQDIGANGIIEFSFVEHNYHANVGAITESDFVDPNDPVDPIPQTSNTIPYMLDMPLVSDTEEDNVGYYCVLSGANTFWPGGLLIIDVSDGGTVEVFGAIDENTPSGASWYMVQQSTALTPHGHALNSLLPAVPGLWDYQSELIVRLRSANFDLANANPSDMISQPLNACVVGNEYIQYANAEELGNGLWKLTGFLRGQRGTDIHVNNHQDGERFIRLKVGSMKRVKMSVADLNKVGTYRAITFDADANSADSFQFANSGNSLRPYAVALWDARRIGDDIYLEWSPRPRQNGGLINGQANVLDQPFETYEIDVMNGSTVVRTVQLQDLRDWTYTSAMHIADFGSIQSNVTFRIYQMGRIIGRGFAREVGA